MKRKAPTGAVGINSRLQQTPIAIVGMATIFPQVSNLKEYWDVILKKADPGQTAVRPATSPAPRQVALADYPASEFDITDASQLMSLAIARQALADAGYSTADVDWERTGIVLGVTIDRKPEAAPDTRLPVGGRREPHAEDCRIAEKIKLAHAHLKWEEDAFVAVLKYLIASSARLQSDPDSLDGMVDAACANSLSVVRMAVHDLVHDRSDLMLAGGLDLDHATPAHLNGTTDGMSFGEGVGMIVLKRLKDAERDGDRVYAVIRGIGVLSKGNYESTYARRLTNQTRTLRRAYEDTGFTPASVTLLEAHGTGTVAGDLCELKSLNKIFTRYSSRSQTVALGSIKSRIGHTKAASGLASVIKTALALHHKVLPPSADFARPNLQFALETSPFYLSHEARPWLRGPHAPPRRGGVNSFGFGRSNYHLVLEEHTPELTGAHRLHAEAAPFILFAETKQALIERVEAALTALCSPEASRHYADYLEQTRTAIIPADSARLGFLASSRVQACEALTLSLAAFAERQGEVGWDLTPGLYYRERGEDFTGRTVALFPGQGSQYVEMGRALTLNFPPLRDALARLDALYAADGAELLSQVVYPAEGSGNGTMLQRTDYTQPAIGVLSAGLYRLLCSAGLQTDFVAGHSFGELTALWAGGVLDDDDYDALIKARGAAMAPGDPGHDTGGMVAIKAEFAAVQAEMQHCPNLAVANLNSNNQVVLAGTRREIEQACLFFQDKGFSAVSLPVSAAFHTPLVSFAQERFAAALDQVVFHPPQLPVYSNVTAQPYPIAPEAVRTILERHMVSMVNFKQEIENIYQAGGRLFIEFGPRNVLTNLVKNILGDLPHLALSLNANARKCSDLQLRDAVVQLRVAGLALGDIDPYQQRATPTHPTCAHGID